MSLFMEVNFDFEFHQFCKFRLGPSQNESRVSSTKRIQLLAAASKFELLFAAYGDEISIISAAFLSKENENVETRQRSTTVKDAPVDKVFRVDAPVIHLGLSCDELTLSVVTDNNSSLNLWLFDIRTIFYQTVGLAAPFAVKHLSGDGASLRELAWNPTQAGLLAVCTDGGCLTLLEVMEGVSSRKTLTSIFTSLSWSPKGKQLMVGKSDGSCSQYDHGLALKKEWPAPSILTEVHEAYVPRSSPASSQPVVIMTVSDKAGDVSYVNFDNICLGFSESVAKKYYFYYMPVWDLVMMSSCSAAETSVVGRHVDTNKTKWEQWTLDDCCRAELPLTESQSDSFPIGMCVLLCSALPWPPGEKLNGGHCPVLMLLSSDGLLVPYWVVYPHSQLPPVTAQPQVVPTHGCRPSITFPALPSSTRSASVLPTPHRAPVSDPRLASALSTSPWAQFPSGGASANELHIPPSFTTSAVTPSPFNSCGHVELMASSSSSSSVDVTAATGLGTSFGARKPGSVTAANLHSVSPAGGFGVFGEPSISNIPSFGGVAESAYVGEDNAVSGQLVGSPTAVSDGFRRACSDAADSANGSHHHLTPACSRTLVGSSATLPALKSAASSSRAVSEAQSRTWADSAFPARSVNVSPGKDTNGPVINRSPHIDKVLNETLNTTISKNIEEEVKDFERELVGLRQRMSNTGLAVGTKEEMLALREAVAKTKVFRDDMKRTTKNVNGEVQAAKSVVLDLFASAEECRCRQNRNDSKHYMRALQRCSLDPVTAHQMQQLRLLVQSVGQRVKDAGAILDSQWDEHFEKGRNVLLAPSSDTLYRAIRTNHKARVGRQLSLHRVQDQLCQIRKGISTPTPFLNDLGRLDTSPDVSINGANVWRLSKASLLKPAKLSALKESLANRCVRTIKCQQIGKMPQLNLSSLGEAVMRDAGGTRRAVMRDAGGTQPASCGGAGVGSASAVIATSGIQPCVTISRETHSRVSAGRVAVGTARTNVFSGSARFTSNVSATSASSEWKLNGQHPPLSELHHIGEVRARTGDDDGRYCSGVDRHLFESQRGAVCRYENIGPTDVNDDDAPYGDVDAGYVEDNGYECDEDEEEEEDQYEYPDDDSAASVCDRASGSGPTPRAVSNALTLSDDLSAVRNSGPIGSGGSAFGGQPAFQTMPGSSLGISKPVESVTVTTPPSTLTSSGAEPFFRSASSTKASLSFPTASSLGADAVASDASTCLSMSADFIASDMLTGQHGTLKSPVSQSSVCSTGSSQPPVWPTKAVEMTAYNLATSASVKGSNFGASSTQFGGSIFGTSSAPSGVSVFGTSSAQSSGSIFGNSSAQSSGSIFCTSSTQFSRSIFGTSSAPSGGSIFGTSSAQSSGSIFGASSAQCSRSIFGTSSAQSSGSIFGNSSDQSSGSIFCTSSAPSGGSIFGTSSAQSSGSIFGTSSAQSSRSIFYTSSAPSGESIFGTSSAQSSGSIFGISSAQSSGSISGTSSAPSGGSIFCTSSAPSGVSVFGTSSTQSGGSIFGTSSAPSGGSIFCTSSAQSSRFIFGTSSAPSGGSIFGTSSAQSSGSIFGTSSAPSGGSIFGTSSAQSSGSIFGTSSAPSSGSIFGTSSAPSGGSIFGTSSAQSSGSIFGTSSAPSVGSIFCMSSAPSGVSVFGTSSTQSGGSVFGASSSQSGGSILSTSLTQSGGSVFGTSTTKSGGSIFGTSLSVALSATSNFSVFGISPSTGASNSAMLGQSPSFTGVEKPEFNFGPGGDQNTKGGLQPVAAPTSPFSSINTSFAGFGSGVFGIGGNPGVQKASQNVFGGSSHTFDTSSHSTLFGAKNSSLFGGPGNPPNANQFGSGHFGSASESSSACVAVHGFAVANTTASCTAGFGMSPAFGASPAFGSSPAFGGSPSFGACPSFGGSPSFGGLPGTGALGGFGANSSFGNAFGSGTAQNTSSAFSNFASTGASTFHSLAQNSDMPSFGSLATASTANFGSQSSQAGCGFGTQAEGFGDQSSAFGGGSGVGSPGFGSPGVGPPGFGPPGFGSSPSFSSYRS